MSAIEKTERKRYFLNVLESGIWTADEILKDATEAEKNDPEIVAAAEKLNKLKGQ